ncbi:hypothetical protein LOTGIDRAFT_175033 [Lottia gigantea]|uniref:HECT domain-containing protein n=1 Tax=Lottia gigantea TaxID=225164 RepID=V4C344_LOTGI|nr:hypothetical protein LOTGIDRAFT_175033 [Lottia gigantea]ESO95924.1 hypothetical protein LOTGIDRAFT_175033 [Lottia gigantea]
MVTKAVDDDNTLPDLTPRIKQAKLDIEAATQPNEDKNGSDLESEDFFDKYVYSDIETPSFDILQQAMTDSNIPQEPSNLRKSPVHYIDHIDTQLEPENSQNTITCMQDTSLCDSPITSTVRNESRSNSQIRSQQADFADPFSMNLCLHRTILQNELIGYFKKPDILHSNLNISFVDEKGQDQDGLSRDAYAGFWDSFYQRNTDEETYRVPILVNEYSQEEWGSIGRILLKGFIDHRYFPINLAPAFAIALIHGEDSITPSILKDSFLLFLSNSEKDVLIQAIDGKDFDEDELLGILDRFHSHVLPHKDELNAFILQVAHTSHNTRTKIRTRFNESRLWNCTSRLSSRQ